MSGAVAEYECRVRFARGVRRQYRHFSIEYSGERGNSRLFTVSAEPERLTVSVPDAGPSPRVQSFSVGGAPYQLVLGKLLGSSIALDDDEMAIYRVAAMDWMELPSMRHARARPSVLALVDGRVLVTGGTVAGWIDGHWGNAAVEGAEVFDVRARAWSEAPEGMVEGRSLRGVLGLQWDPSSGSWIETASLPSRDRIGEAAGLRQVGWAELGHGRNVCVGGVDARGRPAPSIFVGASGTWQRQRVQLETARIAPTVVPLPGDRVLVVGGYQVTSRMDGELDDSPIRTAELVDLTAQRALFAGRCAPSDFETTGALMPDGSVLVVGGHGNCGSGSRSVRLGVVR